MKERWDKKVYNYYGRYLTQCMICSRMALFPRWVKAENSSRKGAWCFECQKDFAFSLKKYWNYDNDR